jgi:hypothetical protein
MLRKSALLMCGALGALLALEALLRLLPTSTYSDTGYYIDPLIITYRPHHHFRSSWGWDFSEPVEHQVNNLGFLSGRDFVPDSTALALIGDSFVDASMLPDSERVGTHLEQELGGRPVYAMGGPGSCLLDYAERIRYAAQHLKVHDFVVVLERGDIKQSYCGSGNIHGPCLRRGSGAAATELRPPPPRLQRYLRHSALLQYLLGHLRFDPAQRFHAALASFSATPASTAAPSTDFEPAELERVMLTFFERIAPYRNGRLVMVFDSNRLALSRGESGSDSARDAAMAQARAHGAVVVDTEASFRDYLARTGRHLEVSPHDKHWNREATRIVAHDIAIALAKPTP